MRISEKLILEIFEYIAKKNKMFYKYENYDKLIVLNKMTKAMAELNIDEQKLIVNNFSNEDKRKKISKTIFKLDQIIYEQANKSDLPYYTKGFYFYSIETDLSILTESKKNNLILFNKKKKTFQLVYGSYGEWFGGNLYFSKEYGIESILDISLVESNSSLVKNSNNLVKILASGLLFGPIGALAGALDKGGKQVSNQKSSYSLRFSLNDVDLAVVDLKCSSTEVAERVINTIKLIKSSK